MRRWKNERSLVVESGSKEKVKVRREAYMALVRSGSGEEKEV